VCLQKLLKAGKTNMPKPLTIGVDVRDLRIAKTGTRTYLQELCNEFKKMDGGDICFHFLDTSIPVYTGRHKLLKLTEHFRYQLWKQLILPLKAFFKGCDIVFCTDNYVPLIHLGYKTIPVFHDAFFFETPQNYGKLWLWLYKKTAIPAAKSSSFVITPTHYAKKQINHFTQITNDKLVVVYEGPKTLHNDTSAKSEQLLQSFSLNKGNYLLHAGSIFKRKNLPALIYAFSKLKQQGYTDLKLVLAGSVPSTDTDNDHQQILDAIEITRLENEVILTGFLPDEALNQLYANALLYVLPSVNEGFGIPVLEAFSHNLPVLVANNSCLPEVGGDAVLQFDPFDIDDMALKIKTALDNDQLRTQMIGKGQERLKYFSWHKTALELVELFKKSV
jgi:glycosyltransferase involved in cell wall biosynthesis